MRLWVGKSKVASLRPAFLLTQIAMAGLSFLGAVLLVGFASGLGVRPRQDGYGDGYGYGSQDGGRNCVNFTIPVTISARQGVFPDIPAKANLEVTDFAQKFVQQGRNYTATILLGYQTVEGDYDISAQYCYPDKVGSTIQILTHGIGFDKTYVFCFRVCIRDTC